MKVFMNIDCLGTYNTIKAFKFRAQAIFSLLEKKRPPPWFTKFEFEYFFYYSTLWVLKESIYNKNLIPRAVLQN
jgi:hypothetical protein